MFIVTEEEEYPISHFGVTKKKINNYWNKIIRIGIMEAEAEVRTNLNF